MRLPRRRLLLLLCLARRSPARAADLDVAALMARLAAIPERRADFRETRYFAALSEPLQSRGRLLFRRPDYLEKITDWPEPERLVVNGDYVSITSPDAPAKALDLARQPELRVLVEAIRGPLMGDLAALRRAFDIAASGTPEGWALDLAPRDAAAARLLRAARIEGAQANIGLVALTQANGDTQTMTITPAPLEPDPPGLPR